MHPQRQLDNRYFWPQERNAFGITVGKYKKHKFLLTKRLAEQAILPKHDPFRDAVNFVDKGLVHDIYHVGRQTSRQTTANSTQNKRARIDDGGWKSISRTTEPRTVAAHSARS